MYMAVSWEPSSMPADVHWFFRMMMLAAVIYSRNGYGTLAGSSTMLVRGLVILSSHS